MGGRRRIQPLVNVSRRENFGTAVVWFPQLWSTLTCTIWFHVPIRNSQNTKEVEAKGLVFAHCSLNRVLGVSGAGVHLERNADE